MVVLSSLSHLSHSISVIFHSRQGLNHMLNEHEASTLAALFCLSAKKQPCRPSTDLARLCSCHLNPGVVFGCGVATRCGSSLPPPVAPHPSLPSPSLPMITGARHVSLLCFRWGPPPLSPPGVIKLPLPSPLSLLLLFK